MTDAWVVFPTYDEADNIEPLINAVLLGWDVPVLRRPTLLAAAGTPAQSLS